MQGRTCMPGRILALAILGLVVSGCRTRVDTVGTQVAPGDVMWGQVDGQRDRQVFQFQGVGYAMLDFDLRRDVGNQAAPRVRLEGPDGEVIPLKEAIASDPGAATLKVRDVMLRQSGPHHVIVLASETPRSQYYSFNHRLKFPGPIPTPVLLQAGEPTPVFVSAPRGARVQVEVEPNEGVSLVPEIRGVEDPWGGRALDRSRLPRGAEPPMMEEEDGTLILSFTAPADGRYKILPAAKCGSGCAIVSTSVDPAPCGCRDVAHPGRRPVVGRTGRQIRRGGDAGARRVPVGDRMAPMPPLAPRATSPAPLPPPTPPSRIATDPILPPPPGVAQR